MAADPGALSATQRLAALAAGDTSQWSGLDDSLDEDAAAEALGPPLQRERPSGLLGGSPTLFHDYASSSGAPRGVRVWFEDGIAVAVEIRDAVVTEPAPGHAEESVVIESAFGPSWRQELHPDRGLVVHRRGGEVALLYGLAPFTVEDWATDPLRAAGPPARRRSR